MWKPSLTRSRRDEGDVQHAANLGEGAEAGPTIAHQHAVPADDRIAHGFEGRALEVGQDMIRRHFVTVANDADYVVVVGRGAGLVRLAAAPSGRPADQSLRALRRFQDERLVGLDDAGGWPLVLGSSEEAMAPAERGSRQTSARSAAFLRLTRSTSARA